MILFFDTETTAKKPHEAKIVQLAGVLCDENRREVQVFSAIIYPHNWTISTEVAAIHGITQELAVRYGIPQADALYAFFMMLPRAEKVVGHNIAYDIEVIERNGPDHTLVKWPQRSCTMRATTGICKLPGPYGYKWPRLSEAYEFFFPGEKFTAHDALADVRACMRIYYHLHDRPKT